MQPTHISPPPLRALSKVRLAMLALGHAVSDGFVSMPTPLWPIIAEGFRLSNSQAGWTMQLLSLFSNFGQPVCGYLTDRYRLRRLAIVGLLVSTVFLSTFGYIRSYGLFIVWLAVGFTGVAVFHPRAGALTAIVSGRRKALGMALFGMGGAVGYALGNLAAPILYELHGSVTGLVYAMPLGLGAVAAILIVNPESADDSHTPPAFRIRDGLLPHLGIVAPLFVVMLLRSAAVITYMSFMPFLIAERDLPLLLAGKAGLFFLLGGALGGVVGGRVSEWSGPRAITAVSLAGSIPFLYWSLHTSGAAFLAMLFVGSMVLRAGEHVNIAQTQRLLPAGQSLASSIGMGLVWGVGGFALPLAGWLSDLRDPAYALTWTLTYPAAAALLALCLPKHLGADRAPESVTT